MISVVNVNGLPPSLLLVTDAVDGEDMTALLVWVGRERRPAQAKHARFSSVAKLSHLNSHNFYSGSKNINTSFKKNELKRKLSCRQFKCSICPALIRSGSA